MKKGLDKYKLHEKRDFRDVRELVETAGDIYSDRIAYSYRTTPSKKETLVKKSFPEFRSDVRALATQFIAMGGRDKHFAIIGKYSYEWVITYFAVLSIGGVVIPLDKDWHASDLADTVKKSETDFLVCDKDITEKAEYISNEHELSAPVIYLLSQDEGSLTSLVELGRAKFEESSEEYYATEIDIEKMSILVFTSGTTGKGKGVMLSQKNVLTDITSVLPYIAYTRKTVGVLPPHHTYCSTVMMLGHALIGSEVYISAGLKYVQKELVAEKPGHLVLVPLYLETFYRKINANIKEKGKEELVAKMIKFSNGLLKVGIDLRKKLFASIRAAFGGEVSMIITGGAPVNPEIVAFFKAIGISTLNGYGITECSPLISVNFSKNIVVGSVGNPVEVNTVKIDEPNEDGEGEILVKGSNVMLGYYKDEETTKEVFDEEGYFRTGDYGKLDENGVIFITGRKKNLIILSNGKNVYPEEIENDLIAVPGIVDIIVYEGKSRRGMEHNAIVAEVYPDKDFFEKNGITDIKAYLKKYVDEYNKTAVVYKRISIIKVRSEEFPKNTLRKILRFKLDMTIE